jgi:hypothetical protein
MPAIEILWNHVSSCVQAVVVTDPYLVSEVLGKETEIEKSIEGVYSKFNVVVHQLSSPREICYDYTAYMPASLTASSYNWHVTEGHTMYAAATC